ncbi:hypothetical protein ADIARSV_3924 [Arcticibacter svalbardensis MN12-7]|uniref:Uncharacterized protein n=2 Tax=Arcticibacter TaxID=1288026 RepID=R9GMB2_9SPHI|nr:hypothetical protein ADIARSV_3924 [Arcticibacter svalbardensis MN12-7]
MPLMLMMSACEQTEYVVPNRTVVVDIRASDWVTYDRGYTWETPVDLPEYDDYNNDEGAILVYRSLDNRNYEQIPQVYNGFAYSYVATAGSIKIEAQSAGASIIIDRPAAMTVKIVLIDSNY